MFSSIYPSAYSAVCKLLHFYDNDWRMALLFGRRVAVFLLSLSLFYGSIFAAGADEEFSAIGLLAADGRQTCSGTIIKGNLILTAAHCIDWYRNGNERQFYFFPGFRGDPAQLFESVNDVDVLTEKAKSDGFHKLTNRNSTRIG